MRISFTWLACAGMILLLQACAETQAPQYFVIRVIDEETGRGVPMVALKLPNEVVYWTDSAGVAAMYEPSLAGQKVFIAAHSDGYEYANKSANGFGLNLRFKPGKVMDIPFRRTMVAERLYRLTGEGIYRDSLMAGLPVPAEITGQQAQIMGQDTVTAALYRGRVFWIWGDTVGPSYWNFSVTAATSDPLDDPGVGVNYDYFADSDGRVKEMLPLTGKGLVWIEGLIPITDPKGEERLVATYTRQDGLRFPEECGLALFDDDAEVFRPWVDKPCLREHYSSHPFEHDGYWYLYPWLRVPNDWDAIQDEEAWESRDVSLPRDARQPSAVVWNEYRQRWILLMEDNGEVYYSEAIQPEGPYREAVKIIHHDLYNFYNVVTHPFFNQDGGRVIYIEGTYTDSFTRAPVKTPRYNYNQVMYRLQLDDPRLRVVQRSD